MGARGKPDGALDPTDGHVCLQPLQHRLSALCGACGGRVVPVALPAEVPPRSGLVVVLSKKVGTVQLLRKGGILVLPLVIAEMLQQGSLAMLPLRQFHDVLQWVLPEGQGLCCERAFLDNVILSELGEIGPGEGELLPSLGAAHEDFLRLPQRPPELLVSGQGFRILPDRPQPVSARSGRHRLLVGGGRRPFGGRRGLRGEGRRSARREPSRP
mmetsp:Transcript_42445/g.92821  ORF Transcript_42445/g.92821 Transcript_42445/m.92821 type:complete len:213 (+) Transcript_42445:3-641(+)